jgi:hypothetical protein
LYTRPSVNTIIETYAPKAGLVTVQGVAVTVTRALRSALIAMIDVAARVIFIFHYHSVVAA